MSVLPPQKRTCAVQLGKSALGPPLFGQWLTAPSEECVGTETIPPCEVEKAPRLGAFGACSRDLAFGSRRLSASNVLITVSLAIAAAALTRLALANGIPDAKTERTAD
jgi:hypothetical protein